MSQTLAPAGVPVAVDSGMGLRAVIGTILLILLGPGFVASLTPPQGQIFDFFKEWASARNRLEGHAVYDSQHAAVERYLGFQIDPKWGYFDTVNTHPPLSVALAMPLARLDLQTAHFAWNVTSLLAFALAVALVLRELAIPWKLSWVVLIAGLLLRCDPLRQSLLQGQPNLFLALLLTGCWTAERRQQPWLAGFLAGTSAMLKIYPGWLLLYFLCRRDWRASAGFVLGAAAATGVTIGILGWEAHADYLTRVLPSVSGELNNWGNLSLTAFWERLFGQSNAAIETWGPQPLWRNLGLGISVLLVAGAALWLAVVSARKDSSRLQADCAFGAQLIAMLLLTPMTWLHSLVILIVPVMVLWRAVPKATWLRAVLLLSLVLLWIPPRLVWQLAIRAEPGTIEAGQVSSANLPGLRIALPMRSLTALSYQTYALVALLGLSWGCRHKSTACSG